MHPTKLQKMSSQALVGNFQTFFNSVHTRGIVKTSGFIRSVCKKFKGFSCGILREQALQRKSKTSRRSPEKWNFLSLAFYNAPSLHAVDFCVDILLDILMTPFTVTLPPKVGKKYYSLSTPIGKMDRQIHRGG